MRQNLDNDGVDLQVKMLVSSVYSLTLKRLSILPVSRVTSRTNNRVQRTSGITTM